MSHCPLVVFSHLRWNSVFQRPQQLMSRFAAHRPVYFIEEPIYDPPQRRHWEFTMPLSGLTVCHPFSPANAPGFSREQLGALSVLMDDLGQRLHLHGAAALLYTPLALPLARRLEPSVLAYDCMDELAAFRGASRALPALEAELMRHADVVFTGGPSLYAARRDRHPNVHCFPSSVDVSHFRAAAHAADPPDQHDIPHPRLGFYGVIDERFDVELIRGLAAARPEWHIVLLGPIVKIPSCSLPQLPNIHYLGAKQYADLPSYVGGWDVCLLPFARNEATRFISPTKTLEYLAAGKPVVSTPITDVISLYGEVVAIAGDVDAFVSACESTFGSPDPDRQERIRALLAHSSWDQTAAAMSALLDGARFKRRRRSAAAAQPLEPATLEPPGSEIAEAAWLTR